MDDKRYDWTPTLTSKLIELYHENKCLWDQTDDKYKDRVKRENALSEISNFFGLTSNEIKRKIHNLRNQFNQEYNKTIRLSHSGDPEDVRSRWSYYDQLKFIRSTSKPSITQTIYVNTSKSRQSIDISYADSSDEDGGVPLSSIKHEPKKRYIEIEEYVPKKVKTQNINLETNQSKIDDGSSDPLEYQNATDTVVEKYVIHQKPQLQQQQSQQQQHRQSSVQQQQHQPTSKKRDYDEMNNSNNVTVYESRNSTVLLEAPSNDNTCNNNTQQGNRREDEYSIFGQFVANELRSLKNSSNRKKLKRLIQKAILEITIDDDDYD